MSPETNMKGQKVSRPSQQYLSKITPGEIFLNNLFSLVVPTYNERENIDALVSKVHQTMALAEQPYELIIVDDNSPDGTADRASELAEDYPVVVLKRSGKLGLASAVTDGWSIAVGNTIGVMDADGSHDHTILPQMIRAVTLGTAEVAIGSRYVPGGGMGNWPLKRQLISRFAIALARPICPVRDLTSGFLVLRSEVIQGIDLASDGFKIGLELLVKGNYERFCEIPYVFHDRTYGHSKLGQKVVLAYLTQLGRLYIDWFKTRPNRARVMAEESPSMRFRQSQKSPKVLGRR